MQLKFLARACAIGLLVASAPALSTFHLMKVVEVFPGTPASPNAQYVVIQMYASGQNLVGGHAITVFNAAGTQTGSFTFPGDLPNGANQTKILIATTQAESFFNLNADLVMSASVLSAGGKVCWAGTLDCVAWGAYHGSSAGVGTPFNAASGLTSGRAAARRLNISGSSTVLDAGDDTDNSASDFVFATPAPRNNAGTSGTIPKSSCGNGVLEGLEQCDDHNVANGDGCSSTCLVEATSGDDAHLSGDLDGDGKSDVLWRNASTGANALWRSANASTQIHVASVTDGGWKIVGRADFNGDGKSDILWRHATSGRNAIWKSGSSAAQQAVTSVTNLAWHVAGVGDFDHDGKADILWRNASTGADTIWKAANSASPLAVSSLTDLHWTIAGVGDFDGDGKADILWRNSATGMNTIWRSANAATKQSVTGVTNLAWNVAGIGDFDGDHVSDVFWRNASSGANTIWRSANASTPQAVATVSNLAWHVASIGDYSGDGKADVVWRNGGSGANTIWKSGNAATTQAMATVANLDWEIVPAQAQEIASPAAAAAAPAQLSIADVSTSEGNSGMHSAVFTVRLSQPAPAAVTYNIATANGSATAGSDYVATSLSGQSIPAGSTSKTFAVQVIGDTTYEDNEAFNVQVSGVKGTAVGDGVASGVIVNDDPYYPN